MKLRLFASYLESIMTGIRTRVACLSAVAVAPVGNASVTVSLEQVYPAGTPFGVVAFDLIVTTAPDAGDPDDWFAASATMNVLSPGFVFDPQIGPADAEFNFAGSAADTFFARFNGSSTFPAPAYVSGPLADGAGPPGPFDGQYTSLAAEWFDTTNVATQTSDTIARYLLAYAEFKPGFVSFSLAGSVFGANQPGTGVPFDFDVTVFTPEPNSLLMLLTPALLRRRVRCGCR